MNLQEKYNRDDFIKFLKFFIPAYATDVRPADVDGLKVAKNALYLGECPELELSIFELTHGSSRDVRVALANDGFKLMKNSSSFRALAVYQAEKSDDWRLSLMTANLDVDKKGKVAQTFSNPRRFSFFLGPNAKIHTPEQYLQGQVKDFEDLRKRFSIETVNKDFYEEIAALFTRLAGGKRKIGKKIIDAGRGYLDLPGTADDTLDKQFTVRLIGRLVFCWFLKKKCSDKKISLLPEDIYSVKAVSENRGYYHGILEPLFFEVLNTPIGDRKNKYQELPWSQIPFLNGGLFNPHQYDFYEPGVMGISKYINTLNIPDIWIKELFKVFETYNFTIDENTPVDVELSIDPEMLGRIFENLLADINPETGETARKATGSYYTPRPIVEYMVDESLKQYLLTKTNIPEQKIEDLLIYDDQDPNLSETQKQTVVEVLDTIKIIDPACGSGAFPMGILQKMLLILRKVDPDSQNWLDKKLATIKDPSLRRDLKTKLKGENFNYIHKLGIVRDAIYGVDIQPIAVEIAKLRFFLSLIVDEPVDDTKENRGIEPLPNLEFKFVCANSLIGLPKRDTGKEDQHTMFEAEDDIKILKELRDEYLRSYGSQKKRIEKKFLKVQSKMAKHALSWALWGGEKSQTMKLSQWNPFSEEPCGWFDSEWMFGVMGGFNVVIANPPYISYYSKQSQADRHTKDILKTLVSQYSFINDKTKLGRFNTLMFFIEKASHLLKARGILCYIVDTNIHSNPSYDIRRFILEKMKILSLVDNLRAFEGVASSQTILMLQKDLSTKSYKLSWKAYADGGFIETFRGDHVLIKNNDEYSFRKPENMDILSILSKINQAPAIEKILGKENVRTCITFTGKKDFFVIENKDKDIDYPLAEGSFGVSSAYMPVKWVQYVRYDTRLRDKLNKEYQNKAVRENKRSPMVIGLGDLERFKAPKIFIRLSDVRITASFTKDVVCADLSLYIITLPNLSEAWQDLHLFHILGVLNSSLATFYFIKKGFIRNLQTGTPQIRLKDLRQLPLIIPRDKSVSLELIGLVRRALMDKKRGCDTTELEESIDELIFDLYELTFEEKETIRNTVTAGSS